MRANQKTTSMSGQSKVRQSTSNKGWAYTFSNFRVNCSGIIVRKEIGFATGEANSRVTSTSNEKQVKKEFGFFKVFLCFE